MAPIPQILSMPFTCPECQCRVVVTVRDLHGEARDAARWLCPDCDAMQELPVLGRVVKVSKVGTLN